MRELEYAVVILMSYLVGSIPCGLVVGKIRGVDIREYGSGKTGATNILRTVGVGAGAIVLVCDLAKGVVAVLIARFLLDSHVAEMVAALVAIVGHNWPAYTKFRGGRGVSTGLGGLLVMSPLVTLCSVAVGVLAIGISRYVSLGSVLGAVTAVLLMLSLTILGREPWPYLIYTLLAAPLIILQHRDNIGRIWAGTELKLGQRAERRTSSSGEKEG